MKETWLLSWAEPGGPGTALSRIPTFIAFISGKLNSHPAHLSRGSHSAKYVSTKQDIARKTESPQRPAPFTHLD